MLVRAKDLRLADTVILDTGSFAAPWRSAVVTQVTDREVTFFRPYATTADFSYTGGVIPYIGTETFNVPRGEHEYEVVARKELR